jgi:hypothetical protein
LWIVLRRPKIGEQTSSKHAEAGLHKLYNSFGILPHGCGTSTKSVKPVKYKREDYFPLQSLSEVMGYTVYCTFASMMRPPSFNNGFHPLVLVS